MRRSKGEREYWGLSGEFSLKIKKKGGLGIGFVEA